MTSKNILPSIAHYQFPWNSVASGNAALPGQQLALASAMVPGIKLDEDATIGRSAPTIHKPRALKRRADASDELGSCGGSGTQQGCVCGLQNQDDG
ncbi:hypothetical protein VTJ04DRAFT_3177 [Mycothermus thermophilus]|uniref:uncharacterized protein n=1 Tax=Humicola insolens TaxID=85995 RepID=UPI003743F84B